LEVIEVATILVTGAGLVGCHFATVALEHGHRVILFDNAPQEHYIRYILAPYKATVVEGDVLDLPLLLHTVQKNSVDLIVHTAGLIGARVYTRPYLGILVNVKGTVNIAEVARLSQTKRVVFCSSMAVYALSRLSGLIHETSLVEPENVYGATKLAAEQLLFSYGKTFDFEVISLRLAGVYGYGPYTGGSWMGKVLYRLLVDALRGQPSELDPSHLGTNEYIYVKDVAEAIYKAMTTQKVSHGIYNIGTGKLTDYEEIVSIVEDLIPQAKINIKKPFASTVGYLKRAAPYSIEKAKNDLNSVPRYELREGFSDFILTLRKALIEGQLYEQVSSE
jgi:UDP-glucose 4-epimerase